MSVTLHTDVGDVKLELFCEECPKTCYNFLALCASDYYNDCVFHRNIRGFLAQTGDPSGTGKGGKSCWEERYFPDEIQEGIKHSKRGMVSMANSGPNKNSSQFFFTYGEQVNLDGKYTVFGHVISGLEVLDDLEKVPVDEKHRPITDIKIRRATIHANPIAEWG
ncbi:hypothetical protein ACHWQZ_G011575 [Mnemiopsis leidyi]